MPADEHLPAKQMFINLMKCHRDTQIAREGTWHLPYRWQGETKEQQYYIALKVLQQIGQKLANLNTCLHSESVSCIPVWPRIYYVAELTQTP